MCGTKFSVLVTILFFCSSVHSAKPSLCAIFTDTGGISGSYSDYESNDCTICASSGNIISNFTQFEVEAANAAGNCGYDYLQIYDGSTTSDTLITTGSDAAGRYCYEVESGNPTIDFTPPDLTSTNQCFTFYFYSDSGTTQLGWVANIYSTDGTSCTSTCSSQTIFPTDAPTTVAPTTTQIPTTQITGANVWALIKDGFKEVFVVSEGFLSPFWDSNAANRFFALNHNDVDASGTISTGDQFSFALDGEFVSCSQTNCMLGNTEEFFTFDLFASDGSYSYGSLKKGNKRYISFSASRFGFSSKKSATIFKIDMSLD